jgi:hypothetical protein
MLRLLKHPLKVPARREDTCETRESRSEQVEHDGAPAHAVRWFVGAPDGPTNALVDELDELHFRFSDDLALLELFLRHRIV